MYNFTVSEFIMIRNFRYPKPHHFLLRNPILHDRQALIVTQIGPLVYGSTTTIGPDGRPVVREFGNVRPSGSSGSPYSRPTITSDRQPLSELSSTDKEVTVTVELPGVAKEHIKINAYDNQVEVTTDDPKRKYYEVIDLPAGVDLESLKSTFTNGLLQITFNRTAGKSKGKANSLQTSILYKQFSTLNLKLSFLDTSEISDWPFRPNKR